MRGESSALGEGLFWMAEKLAWGYEDVKKDHAEALRLYRQAAELGFSDAHIRIGQLQEFGKGTERDLKAAFKSYEAAAKSRNYFAFAYLARLLSRSSHLAEADAFWTRFVAALEANPEPGFLAASRGELLYTYLATQLRLGVDPVHRETLKSYRHEIAAHHQQLLEHTQDHNLERMEGVAKWLELNLGPWR